MEMKQKMTKTPHESCVIDCLTVKIELLHFKATLCNKSTSKFQLQNHFDASLTHNRVNDASAILPLRPYYTSFATTA